MQMPTATHDPAPILQTAFAFWCSAIGYRRRRATAGSPGGLPYGAAVNMIFLTEH